jgi:hypothetical protein
VEKRGEQSQPRRLRPRAGQPLSGTENWRKTRNDWKPLEKLGFEGRPESRSRSGQAVNRGVVGIDLLEIWLLRYAFAHHPLVNRVA